MNSEYRPVPGFPGYEITNDGRLMSFRQSDNGKWTALRTDQDGYVIASIRDGNGKMRGVRVHRLVLLAWVGADEERKCANHKNGIKNDNRLDNLEWVTVSENTKHGYDVLKRTMKGVPHARPVQCIETGEVFPSIRQAAIAIGTLGPILGNLIKSGRARNDLHWAFA